MPIWLLLIGKEKVLLISTPLEAEGMIGPVSDSITKDLEFAFNSSRIPSCRLWAQVMLEDDENETFIPFVQFKFYFR